MAGAKPTKATKLNFTLELNCGCKPPICEHAGPGIAKLLEAAYAKGRVDGMSEALQGGSEAATKAGSKGGVRQGLTARRPPRSN